MSSALSSPVVGFLLRSSAITTLTDHTSCVVAAGSEEDVSGFVGMRKVEEGGGGWRWVEEGGGGWRWVEVGGGGWRRYEEGGGGWRRVEAADSGGSDCRRGCC